MAKAYLLLEDGTSLQGESIGYWGETTGEVVFTTGMTGYTESLTDPSFAGQILVFTYPLLGNYGVPKPVSQDLHLLANFESEQIWVRGVIIEYATQLPSHIDSWQTFSTWLAKYKIPGIAGIDTRALTQKLREHGVMKGVISPKPKTVVWRKLIFNHLVPRVSIREVISYRAEKPNGKQIALIDCGVKHGIIRELLHIGYRVTRVPWNVNPLDVSSKFDGIVCSNGPGDPKDCLVTIRHIKSILDKGYPFLGVCLGHQLLALAIGADTYKLPYGHRGLNQPCQDSVSGKAYVTSQNHGYAVTRKSLPRGYKEWFINLNDQTVEGISQSKCNVKSVQFHPEGCPGPHDTRWIYEFV